MKSSKSDVVSVSHTPTPWRAVECAGVDHDGSVAWDIEVDGHTVAHVYPGENMDADSQFIIKAVNCHNDLLEACKVALTMMREQQRANSERGEPVLVGIGMAMQQCDKAIAKATTQKEGAK